MKELSIKEKAKRYDEALDEAKAIHKAIRQELKPVIKQIFPELEEPEDERIRKAIIGLIKEIKNQPLKRLEDWDKYIAWLEKQGEQKPVNKVEPKFKVGDWVVLTAGDLSTTLQIANVDINKKLYWFNDGSYLPIVDEECLHLWTIQDARDGDVLATKDNQICIFDNTVEEGKYPFAYCGLSIRGFEVYDRTLPFTHDSVYPATKEQRDLLFQKMKEAGYEWDKDKKELKKL